MQKRLAWNWTSAEFPFTGGERIFVYSSRIFERRLVCVPPPPECGHVLVMENPRRKLLGPKRWDAKDDGQMNRGIR